MLFDFPMNDFVTIQPATIDDARGILEAHRAAVHGTAAGERAGCCARTVDALVGLRPEFEPH
jgi:hypothetical protein